MNFRLAIGYFADIGFLNFLASHFYQIASKLNLETDLYKFKQS